jgi:hypothetical protein
MCYIRYSAHSPILDAISSVLQNRADHLTHLLVLWVLGAYNIHSSLPEIVSMRTRPRYRRYSPPYNRTPITELLDARPDFHSSQLTHQ